MGGIMFSLELRIKLLWVRPPSGTPNYGDARGLFDERPFFIFSNLTTTHNKDGICHEHTYYE
jgi:hypothetical protein